MAKVIQLDREVAKTMNNLRHSIPALKQLNSDGQYDVAIRKEKAMLQYLMRYVVEESEAA